MFNVIAGLYLTVEMYTNNKPKRLEVVLGCARIVRMNDL